MEKKEQEEKKDFLKMKVLNYKHGYYEMKHYCFVSNL